MALTNEQYDTLIRGYEDRQRQRRLLIQERKDELYLKNPRLGELDARISTASIESGKLLLDGKRSALPALKEEIRKLRLEKSDEIHRMNYPPDYFDPPYHCPDCKDSGYIGNDKCHCFKQDAIELVYTQSKIRNILERENFEHFSFSYYPEDDADGPKGISSLVRAENAVLVCQDFIGNFDRSFQNLFFYGGTGVGKTFLSNCVAKELLDSGHSVIYFTAAELFSLFERNAFHRYENDFSVGEHYKALLECDLLIIDDLGTETANTFTNSQLFVCLNERILRQKSTIISTNLNMLDLGNLYSERTLSRIISYYTTMRLTGPDIRRSTKNSGGRVHAR